MLVLILKLEYDGTNYSGWQVQKNARSVQEQVEKGLKHLTGVELKAVGAGRTDAGVHAKGMVTHTRLKTKMRVPVDKIPDIMNSAMPADIRIYNASLTTKSFNARFFPVARKYSYYITTSQTVFNRLYAANIKGEIDFNTLKKSAEIFKGEHDFTTFSKYNASVKSYVCKVEECSWEPIDDGLWRFTIQADRFVYAMVRAIVGACIDAARGKRTIDELKEALEKRDRRYISPLAEPRGLFLDNVFYPPPFDYLNKI